MPIFPKVDSFEKSDMNSNVTSLLVYELENNVWAIRGKATSGNGNHAEKELSNDLRNANKLGIKKGASILIEITKSPCDFHDGETSCSEVLTKLKSDGIVGSITIKILGIYQSNSHENSAFSLSGMIKLEVESINVDVWDPKTSPSASQTVFMNQYQKDYDNKNLGGGFWTNPKSRIGNANKPVSTNFWDAKFWDVGKK